MGENRRDKKVGKLGNSDKIKYRWGKKNTKNRKKW